MHPSIHTGLGLSQFISSKVRTIILASACKTEYTICFLTTNKIKKTIELGLFPETLSTNPEPYRVFFAKMRFVLIWIWSWVRSWGLQ